MLCNKIKSRSFVVNIFHVAQPLRKIFDMGIIPKYKPAEPLLLNDLPFLCSFFGFMLIPYDIVRFDNYIGNLPPIHFVYDGFRLANENEIIFS